MCGIWGVFNHDPGKWISKDDIAVAKAMFLFSHLRGDHSSGVCMIERFDPLRPAFTGEPRVIKTVGSMYNIFHKADGSAAWEYGTNAATSVFGHNRYATKGSLKVTNAHPFAEGDWVLVHNGTLYGGVTYTEGVEVDSHALCHKIDQVGIKEALTSISGAFAIIAYNRKTKEIFVCRNGERTLNWYMHDGMSYVMSDALDLEYALKKYDKYRYWPKTAEDGKIHAFKEHVLYKLTDAGFVEVDKIPEKPKYTYTTPARSTTTTYSVVPASKPSVVTDNLTEIEFYVDTIEPKGKGNWIYRGLTLDNEVVVTYTKGEHKDLMGCCGTVVPYSCTTDPTTKEVKYYARFKEIVWDPDSYTAPVEPDPVGTVHACMDCGEPIDSTTGYVKSPSGGYVCQPCIDHFTKTSCQSFLKDHVNVIPDLH